MLKRILEYLTPKRRKAIYGALAAIFALLLALGVITTEQLDASTQAAVAILGALSNFMAWYNTEA